MGVDTLVHITLWYKSNHGYSYYCTSKTQHINQNTACAGSFAWEVEIVTQHITSCCFVHHKHCLACQVYTYVYCTVNWLCKPMIACYIQNDRKHQKCMNPCTLPPSFPLFPAISLASHAVRHICRWQYGINMHSISNPSFVGPRYHPDIHHALQYFTGLTHSEPYM